MVTRLLGELLLNGASGSLPILAPYQRLDLRSDPILSHRRPLSTACSAGVCRPFPHPSGLFASCAAPSGASHGSRGASPFHGLGPSARRPLSRTSGSGSTGPLIGDGQSRVKQNWISSRAYLGTPSHSTYAAESTRR